MARKKSRQTELREFLTEEEQALLSLGRAAEGFMWKHYEAQRLRAERDELWGAVADNHDTVWDEEETEGEVQSCIDQVIAVHDEDDGEPWEEHLPQDHWCEHCRNYNDVALEAFLAGYRRKNARGSMLKAYKKLRAVRGDLPEE